MPLFGSGCAGLGDDKLEHALQEGAAMTWDYMIAYALEEVDDGLK